MKPDSNTWVVSYHDDGSGEGGLDSREEVYLCSSMEKANALSLELENQPDRKGKRAFLYTPSRVFMVEEEATDEA